MNTALDARPQDTAGTEVTVLWAGRWDTYLVDASTVREMTSEERELVSQDRYSPVLRGGWLRCCFCRGRPSGSGRDQVVKIIRLLASGD